MKTGLVSVTFRRLSISEVVKLAAECGLDGIEWGGDVHVPVEDLERAAEVAELTCRAGLQVVSYGSYYRAEDGEGFEQVAETARVLGAPNIRVWAGRGGSQETDPWTRQGVVANLRRACELGGESGLTVSAEYHANTLTDTLESALLLVREVDRLNFKLYWQPVPERSQAERLCEVGTLKPFLSHLHVFQWTRGERSYERLPLVAGEPEWPEALQAASGDRFALLEFVKDDSIDCFRDDASTLRRWCSQI